MFPEKTPAELRRESIGSSTAQTVSLSKEASADIEMVYLVIMAGLMYLTNEGWDKFMEWMRQDEVFSGMEEVMLKCIFTGSIKQLGERADGASREKSKKPAAS